MSALVPPELRELLGLLAQLAETPGPAQSTAENWEARRRAEGRRQAILASRLELLLDVLDVGEAGGGADYLTRFCERSIKACRERLAEPLGYEPFKPDSATQSAES